jgi:hypothetical protein
MSVAIRIIGLPDQSELILSKLIIREHQWEPKDGELLFSSVHCLDTQSWINQRLLIKIHTAACQTRYFHVFVTTLTLFHANCASQEYQYKLYFSSYLQYLKGKFYFRIFPNKTVSEVLHELLKPLSQYVVCETVIHDKVLRNYIQYDTQDFIFLQQLCTVYQLFYFVRTNVYTDTLVITDNRHYFINSLVNEDLHINFLDWQINYQSADRQSAVIHTRCACLTAGTVLHTPKANKWAIQSIDHQYSFNRQIFFSTSNALAVYHNVCSAARLPDALENFTPKSVPLPQFRGIDYAVVKHTLGDSIQAVCPRAADCVDVTFKKSVTRSHSGISSFWTPAPDQVMLLSFEAGTVSQGLLIGGLFREHASRPFDLSKEGWCINTDIGQQMIYVDPNGIVVRSAGDCMQQASSYLSRVHHHASIKVGGSMRHRCKKGGVTLHATRLTLKTGRFFIQLHTDSLTINSRITRFN